VPTTVTMPRLTQTMDTGKILRWLRAEGEAVKEGQPLFEVETDKAAVEVEAPASGFVGAILVPEGNEAPIGAAIAHILAAGEEMVRLPADTAPAQTASSLPTASPVSSSPAKSPASSSMATPSQLRASPLAKKLAAQHGIELSMVKGSGPGGRIDKEDVLAAVAALETRGAILSTPPLATVPTPTPVETRQPAGANYQELSPIRKTTAERMAASSHETARVTLFTEVDATELVHTREKVASEFEKLVGVKLTVSHLLLKACAMALREHPYMLAQWEQGRLRATNEVNLGLAVQAEAGLLVPVLNGADALSLKDLAQRATTMVERARRGTFSLAESASGTFTVTNLGMYGVDGFTPIINPPETAILGVGRIAEKPAVVAGRIEPRWQVVLSLSFDHRVVDGAPAAAFLQRLRKLLETPQLLFL